MGRSDHAGEREQCWRIVPGPRSHEGFRVAARVALAVRIDRAEERQLKMTSPNDRCCPSAQVGHRLYGRYGGVGGTAPRHPRCRLPPFLPDVGNDLKLSLRASAQNDSRQGPRVDRVSTGVIHPPFAEHRMLRRGDQRRFGAVHGRTPVRDWNLEDVSISRPKQVRLYPHLTLGIIEAIGARDFDSGRVGATKPRLVGNPRLEKLDLGRNQRCPIEDGHRSDTTGSSD
jgi:hypothetical protein